jgi:hypothetical protein
MIEELPEEVYLVEFNRERMIINIEKEKLLKDIEINELNETSLANMPRQ